MELSSEINSLEETSMVFLKKLKDLSGPQAIEAYLTKIAPYGHKTALADEKSGQWEKLNFLELGQLTRQISSFLLNNTQLDRPKIALLSESCKEYIPTILGSAMMGATVIPLDIKLSISELTSILKHSEADILIYSKEQAIVATDLKLRLNLANTYQLNDHENSLASLAADTSILPFKKYPQFSQTETAIIIYTSGTTGSPKGVMLSTRNLIAQFVGLPNNMLPMGQCRFLSILPLSHMFNLTCELYSLFWGSSIYYKTSILPHELLFYFQDRKVTHLICVPLFLEIFKRAIERQIESKPKATQRIFKLLHNLSAVLPFTVRKKLFREIHNKFGNCLQGFICGGAPLQNSVFQFFERLGFKIYQGYGLTETGPVCTFTEINRRSAACVGVPITGVEVKIDSNRSKEGIGEILVKGPNIMNGYYKNKQATDEVIDNEGWFRTGDLGIQKSRGRLFITGRAKSMIVLRGGKKVYPEEVESVLSQSEAIEEICVLSLKKDNIERVAAYIRPTEAFIDNTTEEFTSKIEHYKDNLADYKWPTEFILTKNELPKSTTRKIKRNIVKELIDSNLN